MSLVQDIRDYMDANPATFDTLDDNARLAKFREPEKILVERKITKVGVMRVLGASDGAAFIVSLENVSQSSVDAIIAVKDAVRIALEDFGTMGLDLGEQTTRDMLDYLAAYSILKQTDVDALKVQGEKVITLSEFEGFGVMSLGQLQMARAK